MNFSKLNNHTLITFLIVTTAISLFILPLIDAWMLFPFNLVHHLTKYSALGGIIPYSDAQGYYGGANHFLEQGTLDYWSMRRPLNAILFSIRLWATKENFKLALIIQALMCGFSCLMLAQCITRVWGNLSGFITFLVLFLFARGFVPTTLSETLGLTLGCIAFVFLFVATRTKKKSLLFCAGLMLIVGLNARAGAFFILPTILIWVAYHNRSKPDHKGMSSHFYLYFLLGIICGELFNLSLTWIYGPPTIVGGSMHGNFSYTLFGIVSGGKSWTYAYSAFPTQASNLSEAQFSTFIYKESIKQIIANPILSIIGMLRSSLGYVKGLTRFFLDFSHFSFLMKFLLNTTGIITVIFTIHRLKKLYTTNKTDIGLIASGLIGIFLSSAIIWTDGGYRVFAVTVPFWAVALGVVFGAGPIISSKSEPDFIRKNAKGATIFRCEIIAAYCLSIIILFSAILGPLFFRFTHTTVSPHTFSCSSPSETSFIAKKMYAGPHVNLAQSKFKKMIENISLENKDNFLNLLRPDILNQTPLLGIAKELNTGNNQYVVAPESLFLYKHDIIGLCTTKIDHSFVMQVQSYKVLG